MDDFITDDINIDTMSDNMNENFENATVNVKELINKISRLNQKEKEHVLKLFIGKNIQYTKNVNGYFFNLCTSNITPDVLKSINDGINLMEKNRNLLNDIDKKRDLMLRQCKELIENKLNDTIKSKQYDYFNKIRLIPNNMNIDYTISKITKKSYSKLSDYNIDNFDKKTIIYNKNTVYFRLNTVMKLNVRQNKMTNVDYNNYDYGENDFGNCTSEIGDADIDVDVGEIDDNIDVVDTVGGDIDCDGSGENLFDVTDDDVNSDIDEMEVDTDSKEKLYYKQLLNSYGYTFNEDKTCSLVYQDYLV
jgi:hypothetical protein